MTLKANDSSPSGSNATNSDVGVSAPARGSLAGKTVLRFAHAFETGGGTERYLDDLDRALLERNAMTIVRLHLTRQPPPHTPTETAHGLGRLVLVPLPVRPGTDMHSPAPDRHWRQWLKQQARDWILYRQPFWQWFGQRWLATMPLSPQPGQAIGAGDAAARMLREMTVDLAVLHFFGGADAEEVLMEVRRARVPVIVVNHYANDRFLHAAMRKHALMAQGVAGVNGLQVPRYLERCFTNLSDGIDTEYFRREHARQIPGRAALPIVLLPARVVREKGHLDLIRAGGMLQRQGVRCAFVLAGRLDASDFVDQLRREIEREQLTSQVLFLGNQTVDELRDWYAASTVVAFPTYHPEGLGRVIVEAQAMETPVVAYATGGVPDGIETGRTGYLLEQGDIAGMAARIREIVESPSLRTSLANAGRQWAERQFSVAALAERHERFYMQVIIA
jgi:glycosyltransferase involved in cell wall biosynthesis